jgi:hypothetical protein
MQPRLYFRSYSEDTRMRPLAYVWILAGAAPMLLGCPKAPARASEAPHPRAAKPAPAPPSAAELAWAKILRAADRRVVDDDLTGSLSDPEAGVRAKAALALGQIGSAASVPDLRRVSADADPAVRASAVFALGLIAEPSSLPDVLRLAGDDDARVRSAVAEALGRLHDEASEKALDGLLADADPGVRAAAGYASWKLPEPEPLLVKLIQNLGSDQAPVRRAAAYGLGWERRPWRHHRPGRSWATLQTPHEAACARRSRSVWAIPTRKCACRSREGFPRPRTPRSCRSSVRCPETPRLASG